MSPLAIKRPELAIDRDFTIIRNAWARDGRLSLRARGLLLQLYSHRAGWEVTIESLMRVNPEGRNAIRAAIGELEQHGYLKRQQQVSGGRYGGMDYIVCDPLISGVGKTDIGKTDVGEPARKEDYPSEDHPSEVPIKLSASRRKPSRPIPEDWRPLDRHREKAREKNLNLDLQAEAFTNHALANDRRCVNWDRAFDNWILKATPGKADYNPLDRSSYG